MGLVTPFTINMKILFQSLCTTGVDWDDNLDGTALASWNPFIVDLQGLNEIKVPRCYFRHTNDPPRSYQIHGFCDASDKAFAAVVYLRTEHKKGEVETNLIASKTRVAPIKKQLSSETTQASSRLADATPHDGVTATSTRPRRTAAIIGELLRKQN